MDFLPPDDRSDRADRRTLGWTVALGAVGAAYAVSHNPLNIDLGPYLPLYVGVASLVAALALVHAVRWFFRRPVVRAVVTAVGVLVVTYCTWILTFFFLLSSEFHEDEAVLAIQGDLRLVSANGYALIDPIQWVELQRDFGPVPQAAVVWQGSPDGDTADTAFFSGPQEVTVTVTRWDGRVCVYRTGFNLLTLEPEQPHDDGDRSGPGC
jgi:hypothetical protein